VGLGGARTPLPQPGAVVSHRPPPYTWGRRPPPPGGPATGGIPRAITDLAVIVPFNDLSAVERALAENRGRVAGMIVEPVMMNAGIIPPDPGYLDGLRDLLHAEGALLAFDEVKTGFTTGPGGATARYGVVPDIVCLAKALGGGIAVAALGGTHRVMSANTHGPYQQVGTFNGNPLAMAAARATLAEVLTEQTYARLDRLALSLQEYMEKAIRDAGVQWNVVSVGAKGCVTFKPERVRDFRDFLGIDDRYSHAHWLVQHNGGVFLPPWGKVEQWLLSAQHDEADIDLFADNFSDFIAAVTR